MSDASARYLEKLRDPRWQKRRLEILQRDEWACQACFDSESTLAVHHYYYERGREPWDYPDEALVTLCEHCHEEESLERSSAEAVLLQALRRARFLAGDVGRLADGFANIADAHMPEVMASALRNALVKWPHMRAIVEVYFKDIHVEREAKAKADSAAGAGPASGEGDA